MSDFNNLTEADHQTTKALWHEAKGTVRLQAIRIRELEAKVAVYECNAFYQAGYHAATAVSEARIRALEAALTEIVAWDSFPRVKDRDGGTSPYGVAYGSNGERDYMRNIAQRALEMGRETDQHQTDRAAVNRSQGLPKTEPGRPVPNNPGTSTGMETKGEQG